MIDLKQAVARLGATPLLALAAMAAAFGNAQAQEVTLPAGFQSEMLMQTGQTLDGKPVVYPEGSPEITAVIGTIGSGGRTSLYKHLVPTVVYVIDGEVEVRIEASEPSRFSAGESFVGAAEVEHQMFSTGDGPARVLFVFAGTADQPQFEQTGPVASPE